VIPVPASPLDRLWSAFRALIGVEIAPLAYLGVYEYSVTATDGTAAQAATTVDVEPTDPALKMPALPKVPIRLPFGVTPPHGALCSVQFMNGDPSRPMVTNFTDPMTLMVFNGGTLPNARQGDMCAVTLFDFSSAASTAVLSTLAPFFISATGGPCTFTPTPIPPLVIYGIVSTGIPTVKS
jgi:hypothetical protein